MKEQKGLTLVELLAVIVILGIIAGIAVPSIGGIIENSKEKADLANKEIIESAARIADLDGAEDVDTNEDGAYSVTELHTAKYLDDIPTDPYTNTGYDGYVVNGKYQDDAPTPPTGG